MFQVPITWCIVAPCRRNEAVAQQNRLSDNTVIYGAIFLAASSDGTLMTITRRCLSGKIAANLCKQCDGILEPLWILCSIERWRFYLKGLGWDKVFESVYLWYGCAMLFDKHIILLMSIGWITAASLNLRIMILKFFCRAGFASGCN